MAEDSTKENRVVENGEVGVQSTTPSRQSVEVRPMRYVLGIGLVLVIIGMAVSYISI